jgi:hypothetical protein
MACGRASIGKRPKEACGIPQMLNLRRALYRHRVRVDRVMTWDGDDPLSVRHHNMLAFSDHPESCLLERANRAKVRNPGDSHS